MSPASSSVSSPSGVDVQTHLLVARYLHSQGYRETLAAFKKEATSIHPELEQRLDSDAIKRSGTDLRDVVESYLAQQLAQLELAPSKPLEEQLVLIELDFELPSRVTKTIRETHNVLTVTSAVLPQRSFNTSIGRFESHFHPAIFTTSVDRTLKAYSSTDYELLSTIPFPSPVLSISVSPVHPRYLVAGTMDGDLYLIDLVTRQVKQEIKAHQKYIIRTAWSKDGKWFATAGYDRKLLIFRVLESASEEPAETLLEGEEPDALANPPKLELKIRKPLVLKSNPEAVLFIENAEGSTELVLSCRDDHLLRYLEMPTDSLISEEWKSTSYNLNENGDSWCSFSVLYMSLHPSLPILALQTSTENARILLYPIHSAQRLRTLYTQASQSEFFTPRHDWLPSGAGIICNSEDGVLRVVDLQGNLRASIGAHGAAAPSEQGEDEVGITSEERRERFMARREQERGSSVIKGVCVLERDSGRLEFASVGFDKCIRIIS